MKRINVQKERKKDMRWDKWRDRRMRKRKKKKKMFDCDNKWVGRESEGEGEECICKMAKRSVKKRKRLERKLDKERNREII